MIRKLGQSNGRTRARPKNQKTGRVKRFRRTPQLFRRRESGARLPAPKAIGANLCLKHRDLRRKTFHEFTPTLDRSLAPPHEHYRACSAQGTERLAQISQWETERICPVSLGVDSYQIDVARDGEVLKTVI